VAKITLDDPPPQQQGWMLTQSQAQVTAEMTAVEGQLAKTHFLGTRVSSQQQGQNTWMLILPSASDV
jgi:hypothetical protein